MCRHELEFVVIERFGQCKCDAARIADYEAILGPLLAKIPEERRQFLCREPKDLQEYLDELVQRDDLSDLLSEMSLSEHDKRSRSAAESGNSRPHKQAGKWGQESNATNDILGATRLEEVEVAGDEAASERYATAEAQRELAELETQVMRNSFRRIQQPRPSMEELKQDFLAAPNTTTSTDVIV